MPRTTMTPKYVLVDLNAARDQVADVIKASFEKALKAITEDIRMKHGFSCEGGIQGLREQIIANVTVLLPFMKNATTTSFTITSRMTVAPQIKIITLGQEPQMRACIYLGTENGAKKFLHSEKLATTTAALGNLLKRTEKLLEGHIEGVTSANSKRTRANVRTGATLTPEQFNMTSNDTGFWGSDSVNNNSFHETGSFSSDGLNDSGCECGDGENTANHSFSSTASNASTVADDEPNYIH